MHLARCVPKLLQKYFGSLNYGPPCRFVWLIDVRQLSIEILESFDSRKPGTQLIHEIAYAYCENDAKLGSRHCQQNALLHSCVPYSVGQA